MICPTCGKDNSKKRGRSIFKDSTAQRYQCKQCSRVWSISGKNPKLLYFDIETAPVRIEADVWNIWDVHIRPEDVKEDWFVLGWAAKWVCSSSMFSYVLQPKEAKKCDDSRVMKPLWKLFNEADIVIGHNSDKFDIKKMNWRWLVHGYKPPRPYRTVDTLKEARKYFAPTSRSLDFMTKALNLNGKMKHRPGLFKECKEGKHDALIELRKYNEVDVLEGESLYLKMRPWMNNHPNMGLYYETDTEKCKNCGSTDLDFDSLKPVVTTANTYVCWTCINCGANGRTPESIRYDSPGPGEDSEDRKARAAENREKRNSLMR